MKRNARADLEQQNRRSQNFSAEKEGTKREGGESGRVRRSSGKREKGLSKEREKGRGGGTPGMNRFLPPAQHEGKHSSSSDTLLFRRQKREPKLPALWPKDSNNGKGGFEKNHLNIKRVSDLGCKVEEGCKGAVKANRTGHEKKVEKGKKKQKKGFHANNIKKSQNEGERDFPVYFKHRKPTQMTIERDEKIKKHLWNTFFHVLILEKHRRKGQGRRTKKVQQNG